MKRQNSPAKLGVKFCVIPALCVTAAALVAAPSAYAAAGNGCPPASRPQVVAICSPEGFSEILNNPSGKFEITSDIDFRNIPHERSLYLDSEGVLDGRGHTIRNVKIDAGFMEQRALFDQMDGLIKDLRIDGAQAHNFGGSVAVLASTSVRGRFRNITIENAVVRGNVGAALVNRAISASLREIEIKNTQIVARYASGALNSSDTMIGTTTSIDDVAVIDSRIEGKGSAAGIVGSVFGYSGEGVPLRISNARLIGTTVFANSDPYSGSGIAGGLLAYATSADAPTFIKTSFVDHNSVITAYGAAGGLVGDGDVDILESFSNATVRGSRCIGGLVGRLGPNPDRILNSYARGSVLELHEPTPSYDIGVGGIAGCSGERWTINKSRIQRTYASNEILTGSTNAHGLVGDLSANSRILEHALWNSTINPHLQRDRFARTERALKDAATYEAETFLFPPWRFSSPGERHYNQGFPTLEFLFR